jgi:hypothetical protein
MFSNGRSPDYLMPAHCVGEPFYDMVRREMPGNVDYTLTA